MSSKDEKKTEDQIKTWHRADFKAREESGKDLSTKFPHADDATDVEEKVIQVDDNFNSSANSDTHWTQQWFWFDSIETVNLFHQRAKKLGVKDFDVRKNPDWYPGIEVDWEGAGEPVPKEYVVTFLGDGYADYMSYRNGLRYSDKEKNWITKQYLSWRHVDQISKKVHRTSDAVWGLLYKLQLAFFYSKKERSDVEVENLQWLKTCLMEQRSCSESVCKIAKDTRRLSGLEFEEAQDQKWYFLRDLHREAQVDIVILAAYYLGVANALNLAIYLNLNRTAYLLAIQIQSHLEGYKALQATREENSAFELMVEKKLIAHLRRKTFELIRVPLKLWRHHQNHRFELRQIKNGPNFKATQKFIQEVLVVSPVGDAAEGVELRTIAYALLRDFAKVYELANQNSALAQWIYSRYVKVIQQLPHGLPQAPKEWEEIMPDANPFTIFDYIEGLLSFDLKDAITFSERIMSAEDIICVEMVELERQIELDNSYD